MISEFIIFYFHTIHIFYVSIKNQYFMIKSVGFFSQGSKV